MIYPLAKLAIHQIQATGLFYPSVDDSALAHRRRQLYEKRLDS